MVRSVIDSFLRFSWGMSLWTARLIAGAMVPGPMASFAAPADRRVPHPGSLDPSSFVVIGDGLAAGTGDFYLSAEGQRRSFPARLAQQMGTTYTQRLIEAPGVPWMPGLPPLPVRVPAAMQGAVLDPVPRADDALCGFCVPGMGVAQALTERATPPLVWREDATRTMLNLVLGLSTEGGSDAACAPTLLERVVRRRPTIAVVALGFDEVLDAAVAQDPRRLPTPESVHAYYERLVGTLRDAGARVLVLNIPDPLTTAFFSRLPDAATILRTDPGLLEQLYGLASDARVSVSGLVEIGNQLLRREIGRLSAGAVLDDALGQAISAQVKALNVEVESATRSAGGWLFDLAAWLECLNRNGAAVGDRLLTGRYLGGFYTLNGCYPGATGHAMLATALLEFLNDAFDASFPLIDVARVMADDSVALYECGQGPPWTIADLSRPLPPPQAPDRVMSVPAPALFAGTPQHGGTSTRLRLPPRLVQTLPVCKETSYFGEAIRAVNCRSKRESAYGSCAGLLFNGHVMTDSHLSGRIRIQFTPPEGDVTHFTVTLLDGLVGDDSTLVAPSFYQMPFLGNRVSDFPGAVSTGDLDLVTGEVRNLSFSFAIATSGLAALAAVNPHFPRRAITFPGQYGSAWARFEQRPDGLLDFAFFGTTFLPLGAALGGDPLRFPLPFAGPALDYATIPAPGTVMHPHVCLNTRDISLDTTDVPDLPQNTIREYSLFGRRSSFGDRFTLNAPELGSATGRSHLIGRAEIQFGVRSGNSIPVLVTLLGPGGLLQAVEPSAVTEAFPGRLSLGPLGYDELLRFPLRTYFLEGVSFLEDPFDISVGAVDVRSGQLLTDLLHRGFLDQDVFLALLRVEPRTPKSSFYFRGPARFEAAGGGGTIFRFKGQTTVPYPAGFRFPQPDLASAFVIGPGSVLDPFLWLHAIEGGRPGGASLTGVASNVVASNGEVFSYSFGLDAAGRGHFEYTNASQDGTFRLQSVTWIDFGRSRGSSDIDTVSFSGFGIWSKDGVQSRQQASVQISTADRSGYVGILIGGGAVSNVNTKPPLIVEVLP
ncbi:MAG: hypothetical protein HYU37_09730 [Acidobacteria bacterium]|nr:hypothetical protein [Acidobacteriota bacterium]